MCCFPDQIFPNLDKFLCLKELSVDLKGNINVFSVIPEEFPNFHHMEKLLIQISADCDPSKLGKDGTLLCLLFTSVGKATWPIIYLRVKVPVVLRV